MTNTYTTKLFGDEYAIRADFAQAASQIMSQDEDGNWVPTGKQVADYRHDSTAAMRDLLEQVVVMGGDSADEYESEIEAAIEQMTAD